jgi:hypothetical protein
VKLSSSRLFAEVIVEATGAELQVRYLCRPPYDSQVVDGDEPGPAGFLYFDQGWVPAVETIPARLIVLMFKGRLSSPEKASNTRNLRASALSGSSS